MNENAVIWKIEADFSPLGVGVKLISCILIRLNYTLSHYFH